MTASPSTATADTASRSAAERTTASASTAILPISACDSAISVAGDASSTALGVTACKRSKAADDVAKRPAAGEEKAAMCNATLASTVAAAEPAPVEPSVEPQRIRFRFGRVDAAIALADASLAGEVGLPAEGRRPPRYEVMVVVDAGGESGHLENGTPIAPETIERITCDAPLVPVAWRGGEGALDLGRRTRTISAALERALRLRDGGCRFPGCTHHLWTDAHHIVHWSKGGETKASNLLLLCDFHHRLVHEGRFSLQGDAHAPEFRDRGGRRLDPPPRPCVADAHLLLEEWIEEEKLDGRAVPIPHWDGTPMDLGLAVALLAEQGGAARGRSFE
jgi:hypothetical protein